MGYTGDMHMGHSGMGQGFMGGAVVGGYGGGFGPTAYSMGGKPGCSWCHGSGLERCMTCDAKGALKSV